MTVNTQFYFQPLRGEAQLSSVTLIVQARSQFLPFKQTACDTKRDGTSVTFIKTAGKRQENWSRRGLVRTQRRSRSNEAQKRREEAAADGGS